MNLKALTTIFFFFLFFESSPALAGRDISEADAIQTVERKSGKLIPKEDLPALYQVLEPHFNVLARAQTEILGDRYVSLSDLHIVQSDVLNAFVVSVGQEGVRAKKNLVFLTTGLLKAFSLFAQADDPEPQKWVQKFLLGIMGVMGHELGHPVDTMDDLSGVTSRYGAVASQAVELRADVDGVFIQVKAGYPPESALIGLKWLLRVKEKASHRYAKALIGTHPDLRVRVSTLELLLTKLGKDRGSLFLSDEVDLSSSVEVQQILDELKELKVPQLLTDYKEPKTFKEALERLSKPDQEVKLDLITGLKIIAWVSRELNQIGNWQDLSPKEVKQYLKQVMQFAESSFGWGVSEQTLPYWQEYLKIMNRGKVFRQSTYLQYAKDAVRNNSLSKALMLQLSILPFTVWEEVHGSEYAVKIAERINRHPIRGLDFLTEILSKIGNSFLVETQIEFSYFFYSQVYPLLSPVRQLDFFNTDMSRNLQALMPFLNSERGVDSKNQAEIRRLMYRSKALRKKAKADTHRQSDADSKIIEIYEWIWKHRAQIAMQSISSSAYHNVDWEFVFSVLEIDPQRGWNMIRASVQEFCSDLETYSSYLERYKQSRTFLNTYSIAKKPKVTNRVKKNTPAEHLWLSTNLLPFLAGEKFAQEEALDPDLLEIAKKVIAVKAGHSLPREQRRHASYMYALRLEERFKSGESIKKMARYLAKDQRELAETVYGYYYDPGEGLEYEAIEKARLPREFKIELAREFLSHRWKPDEDGNIDYALGGTSLQWVEDSKASEVLAGLLRLGVFQNAYEFLVELQRVFSIDDGADESKNEEAGVRYHRVLGVFSQEIKAMWEEEEISVEQLIQILDPVKEYSWLRGDSDRDEKRVKNIRGREFNRLKKKVLDEIDLSQIDSEVLFQLFQALTLSGPTVETDRFLKDKIYLERSPDELVQILQEGRVRDPQLQVELARVAFEKKISALSSRSEISHSELFQLIHEINLAIKMSSKAKDDFFEDLGWRLRLSGVPLQAFVEDQKSSNLGRMNPFYINYLSVLAEYLEDISALERRQLSQFVLDPESTAFPRSIKKKIVDTIYETLIQETDLSGQRREKQIELYQDADRKGAKSVELIERVVRGQSAEERIPTLKLLIDIGKTAFSQQKEFPSNVIYDENLLGYELGSVQGVMLEVLLELIPEYERSTTLAYLLSQSGEDKSSVKAIFEAYQTVGIKFGQLSSVLELFGEEVAKETAVLKNNADRLSRDQVLKILKSELTSEEFARVELEEVLGSASVKMVVSATVKMNDGTEKKVAIALLRPYIKKQIAANIELGKRFLEKMRERDLVIESAFLQATIEAMEEQISQEINLGDEIKKIEQASELFQKLNRSLRGMGGYEFETLQVVDPSEFKPGKRVMMMELAPSQSFSDLGEADQHLAGEMIVRGSLRMFFQYGYFEPDRHRGNWFFDEEERKIIPIDFGQLTEFELRHHPFRVDERLAVARFFEAVSRERISEIVRSARYLSKNTPTEDQVLDAVHKVGEAFLGSEEGSSFANNSHIRVVKALLSAGFQVDGRVTFGIIKGLATLQGENYVSPERFKELMTEEIQRLYLRKSGALIVDQVSKACGELLRRVQ